MAKQEYGPVPPEVVSVSETLKKAGFEAYLVGGCVRDIVLGLRPQDWDFTTNAKPEDIIRIFPETFYENIYGTVGVVNKETADEKAKVVEVTPYRLESGYSDNRRPDAVVWSEKLDDDLQRRDFTINAIALDLEKKAGKQGYFDGTVVDPYGGIVDLHKKILRTVGDAHERFREDGLRILRAVRIGNSLGFEIERVTEKALAEESHLLGNISKERIRDEFTKMIMSDRPMEALKLCNKFHLLPYIIPELEKTISIEQGGAHAYDVWEHTLRTLQHAADQKWSLELRLASLLHDIGKPKARRQGTPGKKEWTFYGHEVVGARMAEKILTELRYPKAIIEKVTKLVRMHMFFSDSSVVTLSAVRRVIAKIGKDNIWDLMNLRACDRIGTGRPKADPYRLRKYHAMIDEALRDPVSVGMLKIDGKKIMEATGEIPGPKVGFVLHALLEEVLDDPKKNTEEYLNARAIVLVKLPERELRAMAEEGKKKKEAENEAELAEIRKSHRVS
ncbi:MAG: CCA tRNA nucleotidyltransferase [Patescibacteria group bacterium]|nr:CCA tRNA nucleotidyltransferase [Patescibacteria group bacterium]MDE1945719.1 CCA tRNA nucleotidyltransferase [Patescibacteria group bacterium]